MYVDGFIIPVPKNKIDEYKKLAALSGEVWKDCGALSYVESIADDVKSGEHTSFPQSVKLKDDEIVIFSFITYNSREERDQVNEKAMADPRLKDMNNGNFPFDGKRLIWGGFESFLKL